MTAFASTRNQSPNLQALQLPTSPYEGLDLSVPIANQQAPKMDFDPSGAWMRPDGKAAAVTVKAEEKGRFSAKIDDPELGKRDVILAPRLPNADAGQVLSDKGRHIGYWEMPGKDQLIIHKITDISPDGNSILTVPNRFGRAK